MEISSLFFDIDGTLVNNDRTLMKSTEQAIHSLKQQGILVGLATGRRPFCPIAWNSWLDFCGDL